MSRRALGYLALIVTSVVVSACSQPTAPRRDDTAGCARGVVVSSGGWVCAPEN